MPLRRQRAGRVSSSDRLRSINRLPGAPAGPATAVRVRSGGTAGGNAWRTSPSTLPERLTRGVDCTARASAASIRLKRTCTGENRTLGDILDDHPFLPFSGRFRRRRTRHEPPRRTQGRKLRNRDEPQSPAVRLRRAVVCCPYPRPLSRFRHREFRPAIPGIPPDWISRVLNCCIRVIAARSSVKRALKFTDGFLGVAFGPLYRARSWRRR